MRKNKKRKWILYHPHFGYVMTMEEYLTGNKALAAMSEKMSPLEIVEPYIPPNERELLARAKAMTE